MSRGNIKEGTMRQFSQEEAAETVEEIVNLGGIEFELCLRNGRIQLVEREPAVA